MLETKIQLLIPVIQIPFESHPLNQLWAALRLLPFKFTNCKLYNVTEKVNSIQHQISQLISQIESKGRGKIL